ncbi:8351_t:CDS:2, partial [Entrophospora sp. SA101]
QMDLDQENLNLIEEVIELMEEVNYDDVVIEEEGSENECEEDNELIPNTLPIKLSPCVIIDNSKGEISRCCSTEKLVSIAQLFGTWEVDASIGKNSDFKLYEYGVCT